MKNLIKSTIFALSLIATSAQAMPTLFFDGDINYSASTGEFSITSVLTAATDIDSVPGLIGSDLSFTALFTEVEKPIQRITTGFFDNAIISVIGADSTDFLTGELSSLEMFGRNGRNTGLLSGDVSATNGLLAGMFGNGTLSALEFNVLPGFSGDMFKGDFTGRIDGRIEGEAVAVSEPNILALLGLGLIMIRFAKRRAA